MNLINITLEKYLINISINLLLLTIVIAIIFIVYYIYRYFNNRTKGSLIIDEIQLGIGKSKINIKYNSKDKEIAYKLWIELSTRMIGLRFDEDEDVIIEVYNSWYKFFEIARELIKDIPIHKINNGDDLIEISIGILNNGLRPHLTKWQAKYKKWYEDYISNNDDLYKSPQEIQRLYPEYDYLVKDLIEVNNSMVYFKNLLYDIAFKKSK